MADNRQKWLRRLLYAIMLVSAIVSVLFLAAWDYTDWEPGIFAKILAGIFAVGMGAAFITVLCMLGPVHKQ